MYLKNTGRGFIFAWFFLGGIAHFTLTEFFLRIVPPYIPYPIACVYISGVFELLGAFGILLPKTRQLAGYGLILLTTILTLANIHMYLHAELFAGIPEWMLAARLPLQAVLIWLIWWSTKPDTKLNMININRINTS